MSAVLYRFHTRAGSFEIRPSRPAPGRWEVWHDDEQLGSYSNPHQAAEDVAGGYTFFPSSGIDPGELGISDDLGDWDVVPIRPSR